MNLTKEVENAGYKAVVMPVEVGARGFVVSSVYDLLTKLSICGNKRTKALKLLAEIAENSSRWIWIRRKWYSARIRVWVRILALCKKKKKKKKKKITGRHLGVMTWVWPGPLSMSEVQGRNTCYKRGFFSEDSLLSSSPMSFYLLQNYVFFSPLF